MLVLCTMYSKFHFWLKPIISLVVLAILLWLLPVAPLDPWNLLSPNKIAKMVFALVLIQVLSSGFAAYTGPRAGALLTGFLGGLISSTATTASLARRSHKAKNASNPSELLTFLSATGAMLFEAVVLVVTGVSEIHYSTILLFLGPLIATLGMIIFQYKKMEVQRSSIQDSSFQILPILKLSIFIIAILTLSKISQNLLGNNGLLILTWLVSLFEIHGSIIANLQLHELGKVNVQLLCSLLAISVVASYMSKLFLIYWLGSPVLKAKTLKSTVILFLSLAISWFAAVSLT